MSFIFYSPHLEKWNGTDANTAAKPFLVRLILRGISALTPVNNPINAIFANAVSPSAPICNDTSETSIIKRDLTVVHFVTGVLDSKPIWIDICENTKMMDPPS